MFTTSCYILFNLIEIFHGTHAVYEGGKRGQYLNYGGKKIEVL